MRKIKGYVAAILSLCMVLTGSMTAFAAEPGQQPEEPALVEGSARIIILPDYEDSFRYVTGNDVLLRATPGLSGRVVGRFYRPDKDDPDYYQKLPWVILNGEAEIVDGHTWLRVTSSSINATGWIAKDYVQ